MAEAADRRTARNFIADWFGFTLHRVDITRITTEPETGRVTAVYFKVHSLGRVRYLAKRGLGDDWQLIVLP